MSSLALPVTLTLDNLPNIVIYLAVQVSLRKHRSPIIRREI